MVCRIEINIIIVSLFYTKMIKHDKPVVRNGPSPCCNADQGENAWCGSSDAHCACSTCVDFRLPRMFPTTMDVFNIELSLYLVTIIDWKPGEGTEIEYLPTGLITYALYDNGEQIQTGNVDSGSSGRIGVAGSVDKLIVEIISGSEFHGTFLFGINGRDKQFRCMDCLPSSQSDSLHRLYISTNSKSHNLSDYANCNISCEFVIYDAVSSTTFTTSATTTIGTIASRVDDTTIGSPGKLINPFNVQLQNGFIHVYRCGISSNKKPFTSNTSHSVQAMVN